MTQHKDDHTDELADRIAEADRIASEGIGALNEASTCMSPSTRETSRPW